MALTVRIDPPSLAAGLLPGIMRDIAEQLRAQLTAAIEPAINAAVDSAMQQLQGRIHVEQSAAWAGGQPQINVLLRIDGVQRAIEQAGAALQQE